MAYSYGQEERGMWDEETLPDFQEIVLQSNDKPKDRKIYVMYHGTTVEAARKIIEGGFKQSSDGMLGRGVYVSRDIEKAARYPLDPRDKPNQVILKLRVNVGKVIKIAYQEHSLQKSWQSRGYDTAWVPPYNTMVSSGLEEDCVCNPTRIKVVGVVKAPKKSPATSESLSRKVQKINPMEKVTAIYNFKISNSPSHLYHCQQ